ncbi:hypothetical protein C0J52_11621 [Blattella germanica]|nr:hypothetical protein C0J52_11621 [Blattella germanica]
MSGNQSSPRSDTTETGDGDLPAEAETQQETAETNTETEGTKQDKQKIDILLKPTGNAPIMKKRKWAVDPEKKISWIIEFMRRYLNLDRSEQLVSHDINAMKI